MSTENMKRPITVNSISRNSSRNLKTTRGKSNFLQKAGVPDSTKQQSRADLHDTSYKKKRVSTSDFQNLRRMRSMLRKEANKASIMKFKRSLPETGITEVSSDKYSNVLKQYILSNRSIANELINMQDNVPNAIQSLSAGLKYTPYGQGKLPKMSKSLVSEKIDMHIKKKQLVLEKFILDRIHAKKSIQKVL